MGDKNSRKVWIRALMERSLLVRRLVIVMSRPLGYQVRENLSSCVRLGCLHSLTNIHFCRSPRGSLGSASAICKNISFSDGRTNKGT